MQRDPENNDNINGAQDATADHITIDHETSRAPANENSGSSITRARIDTSNLPKKPRKKQLSKPVVDLPKHRGSWASWLILLACLCLALVPLLIDLSKARATLQETQTASISIDSWQHQKSLSTEGLSFKRFTPTKNNQLQFNRAPGITWMHLLFFAGLSASDTASISQQTAVYDARLVSVLFALLAIAGIFWAGYSLGGTVLATIATLVCIATPVFLHQGRIGTAQMPTLALSILAIAAALWAIRPLRPVAGIIRQSVGWTICGLALAIAILTGGGPTLPPLAITLIVLVAACPHRAGHLMGLTAAGCIAALVITPWAIYIHTNHPNAWQGWLISVTPSSWQHLESYGLLLIKRLGMILAIILPWSLWLIGGLLQPFSTSSSGSRRKMFLGWSWFVTVAVLLLAAPGNTSSKTTLIVIPATAIVLGQLFTQYIDLSSEGRHASFWNINRWVYAILALAGSLAIPALMQFQPYLLKEGYLHYHFPEQLIWAYALGAFIILTILAIAGLYYAARHHPGRAIGAWALWAIVATTIATIPMPGQNFWQTKPENQSGNQKKILVLNSPDQARAPYKIDDFATLHEKDKKAHHLSIGQ